MTLSQHNIHKLLHSAGRQKNLYGVHAKLQRKGVAEADISQVCIARCNALLSVDIAAVSHTSPQSMTACRSTNITIRT